MSIFSSKQFRPHAQQSFAQRGEALGRVMAPSSYSADTGGGKLIPEGHVITGFSSPDQPHVSIQSRPAADPDGTKYESIRFQ